MRRFARLPWMTSTNTGNIQSIFAQPGIPSYEDMVSRSQCQRQPALHGACRGDRARPAPWNAFGRRQAADPSRSRRAPCDRCHDRRPRLCRSPEAGPRAGTCRPRHLRDGCRTHHHRSGPAGCPPRGHRRSLHEHAAGAGRSRARHPDARWFFGACRRSCAAPALPDIRRGADGQGGGRPVAWPARPGPCARAHLHHARRPSGAARHPRHSGKARRNGSVRNHHLSRHTLDCRAIAAATCRPCHGRSRDPA